MAAPQLHSDQYGLNADIGENLNLAYQTGLLLDSDVGGGKTEATMEAAIQTNAAALASDRQGLAGRLIRALQYGAADGTLTTANIQAASTIAGLVALTQAAATKIGPVVIE